MPILESLSLSSIGKIISAIWANGSRFLWSIAVAGAASAVALWVGAHYAVPKAQAWWDEYGGKRSLNSEGCFRRWIRAAVTLSRDNVARRSSVSLRAPATTRRGRSAVSGPPTPISIGFAEGLAPSDAHWGFAPNFPLLAAKPVQN
jgi:hypothetical protein